MPIRLSYGRGSQEVTAVKRSRKSRYQEAKMSVCSGPLVLPHCAAGARDKVERVWGRCGHSGARRGVGVICWGCGVWHRSVKHSRHSLSSETRTTSGVFWSRRRFIRLRQLVCILGYV